MQAWSNSCPYLINKLRQLEASLSTMMLEAKIKYEKEISLTVHISVKNI